MKKIVSRKEIWEFLREFLEAGGAVEAEHAVSWMENDYTVFYEDEDAMLRGEEGETISIMSLSELVEFMVRYIKSAVKWDMKADDVLEDVFKAFGEEFIIAEDNEKVNKDDSDTYEIIYKIALGSEKSQEIFREKAIERIAIEILEYEKQKGKRPKFLRSESVNINSIDVNNLYDIWRIRIERKRVGYEELEKDINEVFPELVIKLFGEGVIFKDADDKEVELDWGNVYEVIPPAIKKLMLSHKN